MNCAKAESECLKNDAHLASIHSVEENEFITTLHDPTGYHYTCIGGQRDGNSFRWIDGSDFNYQNWNTGEPNKLNGNMENCMELYIKDDKPFHGKWNDNLCDSNDYDSYVCKKDKLGMQL